MGDGPDKRYFTVRLLSEDSYFGWFRLAFIEDYTLKSLRLKTDKWNKLIISDDQRGFLHSFVDQGMKFVD